MPRESGDDKTPSRGARALVWFTEHCERPFRGFILVVGLTVDVLMALNVPSTTPLKKNPGYLDVIFASRSVLFSARLLLVEGALFLVASIVVRILRGGWASRAGGVETAEPESDVEDAIDELAAWKDRAGAAEAKVDAMGTRLRDTEENLKSVLADLEKTEAELGRMRE